VKKEFHLDGSVYQLLQILSVYIFDKIEHRCAFTKVEIQIHEDLFSNPLFDF